MNQLQCSNCASKSLQTLNEVDSNRQLAAASDGSFMRDTIAKRTLCQSCACIEIHYTPDERLKQFFESQYDVSDSVQNNRVVFSLSESNKHDLIAEQFYSAIGTLNENGRFLEVACGKGNFAKAFAKRHRNWICRGIDPLVDEKANGLENLHFTRDFFTAQKFSDSKFDVIVAHGFLNRVPTLPGLLQIASLLDRGGLASFEVVVLENSIYSPHVWDHSHTYLKESFVTYLAESGFEVLKEFNCGSSIQFVCRYIGVSVKADANESRRRVETTLKIHQRHLEKWNEIVFRFQNNQTTTKPLAIFGAGLFSAVLLSLVDDPKVDCVIDEIRQGSEFLGVPVIGEAKAKLQDPKVLLCSRPEYMDYLAQKLESWGLDCVRLS